MQQKIYEFAKTQEGVEEIPGPKANKKIIEYHSTCTLAATSDDVAWCSAFVNWCVTKAGLKGTNNAMARSWLLWGDKVKFEDLKEGDLVILRRGSDGISGHVGFVAQVPKASHDTYIEIFGGNQGNKVCQQKYFLANVLGYRRAKISL